MLQQCSHSNQTTVYRTWSKSRSPVLTLLEVLDVLGGEGDPDAVHVRLLLAEALALDVSRHAFLCGSRIDWLAGRGAEGVTSAVTCHG